MRISDWSSDVCSSDLFEMRLPAVEERREETLEMAIHRLERREQPRAALAIEAADRTAEAVDRLRQFLDLGGASLTLGIEFDEFVGGDERSEEHTSELQSLMRISYAVFCLKNKI